MENFSTTEYFCRYCYITLTEFRKNFRKYKSLRSKISYDIDVQNIKENGSSRGVKSYSSFHVLNFYHVGNQGLPPCIAHDLYECIIA